MSKIIRISKLKKRQEFLIVSKEGRYVNCNNFILQFHKRPSSIGSNKNLVRYGITASKKVGNAILRNKAKRRIRVLIIGLFSDNNRLKANVLYDLHSILIFLSC